MKEINTFIDSFTFPSIIYIFIIRRKEVVISITNSINLIFSLFNYSFIFNTWVSLLVGFKLPFQFISE